MTQKRSAGTSLKSCRSSARLNRDNENASEPMRFRGVAASMELCFDLCKTPSVTRSVEVNDQATAQMNFLVCHHFDGLSTVFFLWGSCAAAIFFAEQADLRVGGYSTSTSVPAAIINTPHTVLGAGFSPRMRKARIMVRTMLHLSTAATRAVSPICSAL